MPCTVMSYCFFFSDDVIQYTAIMWIKEFLTLSGRTMLPFYSGLLKAILHCVSYDQDKQNILYMKCAVVPVSSLL